MSVVAVWHERGLAAAEARARETLPTGTVRIRVGSTVISTTDAKGISENAVVVGESPTHSRILVRPDGLTLERGPSWSAPIYFRSARDEVVACSHVEPLLQPRESIDEGYLGSLVGCYVRRWDARTVFSKIAQVRSLETLAFEGTRVSSSKRSTPRIKEANGRIDDLADELRHHVFAAVARVCAGRRVAIMVGGLDSSTVLAAAIEGGAKDVIGMTVDFPGPGDDRPHVRSLEKHFGIPVVRIRPEEFREASRKTIVHDGAPSRHPGDCFGLVFGRRASELGADLVITGGGGDEIFGTDIGPAFAFRLRRGDLRAVPRALRTKLPHDPTPRRRLRELAVCLLRPHLPHWIRARRALGRQNNAPTWLGPILRGELRAVLEEASTMDVPAETAEARWDALARSPHESFFAEVRAQTDAAGGAPRVDPIFDGDLVRFVASIPPDLLFADDVDRGLLRRGMRGWLPESNRMRIDKAKFAPAFAGAIWPIDDLEPFLKFERLERAGLVRASSLASTLQQFYEAPERIESGPTWNYFWPALTAEAFLAQRAA